jgi:hypothetical protein
MQSRRTCYNNMLNYSIHYYLSFLKFYQLQNEQNHEIILKVVEKAMGIMEL